MHGKKEANLVTHCCVMVEKARFGKFPGHKLLTDWPEEPYWTLIRQPLYSMSKTCHLYSMSR